MAPRPREVATMDRLKFTLVVTLSAARDACMTNSTSKPESRIDPNPNISASKTFGWQPANTDLVSTDIAQRKFDENVKSAINTDMVRKGYTQVDADPDLLLSYDIS